MVDCGGLHVYLSGNRYGGLSNPHNIMHAKQQWIAACKWCDQFWERPQNFFKRITPNIVRGTPNVQCRFPVCFLLPPWAYRKPSMENYWKNVFIGWLVPGFSQSFMTLIDAS